MSLIIRVAHFPQVPCPSFDTDVASLDEALRLCNTLALYDLWQYNNRIKPDYCNATYILLIHDGEILEECDPDDEDEVEFLREKIAELTTA